MPAPSVRTAGPGCGVPSGRRSLMKWWPWPTSEVCSPDEHFSVDGTQIEAWVSLKSFHRRPEDPTPSTETVAAAPEPAAPPSAMLCRSYWMERGSASSGRALRGRTRISQPGCSAPW